jgi:F-type H+-transporting ATPase subunit b
VELSWSTFVLEIINFLVLIWILKRFFYQPVLQVIARRRAETEKRIDDAETLHAEAEKLKKQYKSRLTDWDKERRQARESLAREIEKERTRKIEELHTILEQEQEKAQVAETRRQADAMRKIEESALRQGARFASRLLEQSAGPETEARLIELLISELSQLTEERIAELRNNYSNTSTTIVVASAFPLSDDQQQRLTKSLERITTPGISIQFEINSELLAGVQVTIGAWVLAANIRDELNGFMELGRNE